MNIEAVFVKIAIALPGIVILWRVSREYMGRRRDPSLPRKSRLDSEFTKFMLSMTVAYLSIALIWIRHELAWPRWIMIPLAVTMFASIFSTFVFAYRAGYHSFDHFD